MTRTLAVDQSNDIYVGPDGNIAQATGLTAVLQACAEAAKAQLGEMIYAVDQGLPNFDALWNGSPNLRQYEAYLRANLLTVPDVIGIESVTIAQAGNAVVYTVVIQTIYGNGTLSNG